MLGVVSHDRDSLIEQYFALGFNYMEILTVARKGHTWCVLFSVRRDLRISTYNARSRLITRDLDL